MINKSDIVVIPDELKDASNQAKKYYLKWLEKSKEIENHKLRFYTAVDKHGDPHTVDCLGVWRQLFLKFDKLKGIPESDYDEVQRRCLILHKLKTEKGQLNRKWSREINKNHQKRGGVLEFRKGDILESFGRYMNVDQVGALIKEWGLSVSRSKLQEFYYANKEEIDERRARFAATEKDFYLATGAGRIESLSYLFTKIMELFESTDNVRYAAEVRAIIEQVRKEVKGDEIRLTVDGKIDVTATIQANRTVHEMNQKIPINLFIVALVSAKKGIDPVNMMTQLGNSFYSRYNGFQQLEDADKIKLPSHLIASYDWNAIEGMHKEKEELAKKKLYNAKLTKFFADNGVNYDGNVQDSLRKMEDVLSGEVVPEIMDVKPLETTVPEEKKEKVLSKRELLKKILEEKKKHIA